MSTQKFAISAAHSEFELSSAPGQHQALEEANPSQYSPSPPTINLLNADTTLHAARWARLKDHLADIASLMPAERNAAIEVLQLEDDDRRWLKVLAKPLLSGDPRLSGTRAFARTAVEDEWPSWRPGDSVAGRGIEALPDTGGRGEH